MDHPRSIRGEKRGIYQYSYIAVKTGPPIVTFTVGFWAVTVQGSSVLKTHNLFGSDQRKAGEGELVQVEPTLPRVETVVVVFCFWLLVVLQ